MLLGNPDVEGTVGHFLHHELQAASRRHGRGHPHNASVGLGQFDDAVPKHVLELGGLRRAVSSLQDLARLFVEQPRSVPLGGASRFGRSVPRTFARHHVKQLGARNVLEVFEHLRQVLHVVAVDRTKVPEVQRLKEVALLENRTLDGVFDLLGNGLCVGAKLADSTQQIPHLVLHLVVGVGGGDVRQILLQSPHVGVDGHAVVVEDDQHVGVLHTAVVEALEGQTRGHGAVADHGHVLHVSLSVVAASDRHAKGSADACAAVSDPKGVVLAFAALGKPTDALVLAVGVEPLATSGQNLVAVGLVPHVPHDLVFRGVEGVVQGDGQFDHP